MPFTALPLLPRPVHEEQMPGEFMLTAQTTLSHHPGLESVAISLQNSLRSATGFPVPVDVEQGNISLLLDPGLGESEYSVSISPNTVEILGGDAAGVFYGCQTFLQLLPAAIFRSAPVANVQWSAPACHIADKPRFGWRGIMLDVVRHFLPKREIFRFIDLMAMHKLNTLHLHLSDDQGWRVEILRYPKLTQIGAWRRETQVGAGANAGADGRPHGGYYTQGDIREIVAYARLRFIDVVPEIETPGHVQAALAAYPELGVTDQTLEVYTRWGINYNVLNVEDSTVEFFNNVFDEIMDIFPGKYIGVGGDECPKDQWRNDPRSLERMADLGLNRVEDLQSWFIAQMETHISAHGRRIFGWDEILEGELAPTATVASWRGMTGARSAARRGHDVVCCPDDLAYFDYRQSLLPSEPIPVSIPLGVAEVYGFDPVPHGLSPEQALHILGGQANLWTEHIDSARMLDYMAFPRLCAMAEVLWATGEKDLAAFTPRLEAHLARLDAVGVEYRQAEGPLPWQQRPGVKGRPETHQERAALIAKLVASIKSSPDDDLS
ncbi:beta-N-acetylhexosaminidase [Arthrobacter cryoconiti]|uniref:beta-N-acetylhexosaminidase n=1 Tax=Arthrobacter cryoconiti TaxID=748907 RepID=A0ABV8R151_9MICC|nr:beta-N-acetylhexosaminidase [Arthrobacter cryoconiti]MCC9068619.1 beta-N-acetylhexosaminidase [Arthrobacter cryoconiti]